MTEAEHGQGKNLVVVYRAPDEITANLVRGLLESEEIPAVLESHMVPWMNGVMKTGEGYWGDVVVPKEHADRSKQLIEAYHASTEDNDVPTGDDEPTE